MEILRGRFRSAYRNGGSKAVTSSNNHDRNGGRTAQALLFRPSTSSRSSWLGLKKGILFGGISTWVPVFGLRPMRAAPKSPRISTLSPDRTPRTMLSKYGANDDLGLLPGPLDGLTHLLDQIGPSHLAHPLFITKKSITAFVDTADANNFRLVAHSESAAGTAIYAPGDRHCRRR